MVLLRVQVTTRWLGCRERISVVVSFARVEELWALTSTSADELGRADRGSWGQGGDVR